MGIWSSGGGCTPKPAGFPKSFWVNGLGWPQRMDGLRITQRTEGERPSLPSRYQAGPCLQHWAVAGSTARQGDGRGPLSPPRGGRRLAGSQARLGRCGDARSELTCPLGFWCHEPANIHAHDQCPHRRARSCEVLPAAPAGFVAVSQTKHLHPVELFTGLVECSTTMTFLLRLSTENRIRAGTLAAVPLRSEILDMATVAVLTRVSRQLSPLSEAFLGFLGSELACRVDALRVAFSRWQPAPRRPVPSPPRC